jgi:branched-chain amino acid transport system permease protein
VAVRRFGWSSEYPMILFGVGAVHALSQGGGGISATFPWRRPRHSTAASPVAPASLGPVAPPPLDAAPVLEVRGLEVRFGALAALSEVDLVVPPRAVVGLIGPNGAGKSTLVDAVGGFLRDYRGQVLLEGRPVDGLGATARAKAGLRRTFQQGRAIPELTVGEFVNVYVPRPLPPAELDELLGFFGLPPADEPIEFVDVGTRRVLEVAACVASRPRVALLDEPAAGLGESQSADLAERIRELPERYGCSVVLIEHDVELVARVCSRVTVLDFGIVLASGPPAQVLTDRNVASAYLGADVDIDPAAGDGQDALAAREGGP